MANTRNRRPRGQGKPGGGGTSAGRPKGQGKSEPTAPDLPRTIIGFLVGILVGITVLGLVWIGVSSIGDHTVSVTGKDVSAALPSNEDSSSEASSDDASSTPAALTSCRQADHSVQAALGAAVPALTQWEIHVGAMNSLVAGAISMQQANKSWNQTRLEASHHLTAFWGATRQAAQHSTQCRSGAMPGMKSSPEIKSCTRRLAADRHALDTAEAAIKTWSHHVTAMNMLRMGHLTPAKAQRMWLASWKEGIAQIRAYNVAVRAARTSGDC
jgi:hypothetical protein